VDVRKFVPEITRPAQHKIEIARMPDGAIGAPSRSQLPGSAAFELAHDRYESDAPWCEEKMGLTWHDHVAEYQEFIGSALPPELFEYEVAFAAG
jgi:hypothetical protein